MKRRSSFLLPLLALALLMALPAVTAAAAPEAKGTVTFVFWDYGPDVQKGWETTLTSFNTENPAINVQLVGAQGNSWGEYLDKVATMIAGGKKPDTMWVATEGIRQLATKKLIRPIDDLVARDKAELQEYFNDVAPSLVDGTRVDGKLYGFPYSWNNMVIWYRPSHLKAAGLAAPRPDWTRDDFLRYAQKLTKENVYGYAVENAYFVGTMPWLFANGTSLFDDRFTKATANDPKVAEAMQFLVDLVHKYKVAPDPAGVSTFNMFQAGQLSMFGAGRWPIMTFSKDASFKDFDIQLWPKGQTQITEYGVDNFPIFTSSQNVEATWKLVKYMARKDVQAQMVGTMDRPVGNIPARRSLATSPDMASIPNYKVFYASLNNAKSVPAPPAFNKVESIWLRYVSQMTAGELPVKDALDKAQAELTQVLAENR
jgi:ABC-type glycerol-3-phosphate transport system substrate-binding protein